MTGAFWRLIVKYMLNYPAPKSLDALFHAMADPTRRGIVERLGRGPVTVSELAEPLDISLPAVMQHLKVLESSGIVRSEKQGRVRTCRLETSALRTMEDWIAERRQGWMDALDRLEELLASEGDGAGASEDANLSPHEP